MGDIAMSLGGGDGSGKLVSAASMGGDPMALVVSAGMGLPTSLEDGESVEWVNMCWRKVRRLAGL